MGATVAKTDLTTRIETALDTIRPFMRADGGDVNLIGVTDDMVAHVELTGACKTCNMSSMTMKAGVEEAVLNAVPELEGIVAVEIEGS